MFFLCVTGLFSSARATVQDPSAQVQIASADLKHMSLEQLSQIEVTTPTKEPEEVFRTPAAIYVITADDIQRAGVVTIPEALRLAPGVEVARIDADKWSIGIRGFGSRLSRSVLVLIDGRTVYSTLLAGTYWEVQDLLLQDIDRIEVIRGPGGTIWGPNAVNGVINIITKNAKDTQGALVAAGGGNERQGEVDARYGGTQGRVAYRVFGKIFTNGPEFHPDGRNFDDWRAQRSGFRMDWANDSQSAWTLEGDIYRGDFGESVVATSYTSPYSQVIDANADLSGGDVVLGYKRRLRNGNDFQLETYYDRTNRHEPNFGDVRDTFDVDFVFHQRIPARQILTYGVGVRLSYGRNDQVVSGLTFDPASRTDQLLTGFIQDDFDLIENRLSLTVGTKLLHTNFATFEPEPSARIMWTPTNSTGFWAAFTHAVRTPSDAERDFFLSGYIGTAPDGLPFFARFNANRNFTSEQMNGYEAGYRQLLGKKVYIDVAAFFNHYHDLFSEDITGAAYIEDDPAPAHVLLPAEFGNGLLGQTKGIEIAPEWQPTHYWRLRGSYSYLHMNLGPGPNSMDVGTAPGIMGSSPQHQVAINSSFDLGKPFQLDLYYRYVSALPGQTVPAYSTGDATFQWRMNPNFRLLVNGHNLFQPHHPEFGTDPGPLVGIKRSIFAQLTWTR